MSSEDWAHRVTALPNGARRGDRALHKPLLLLYVRGRLQHTGSSVTRFAEAEADLRRLLEEAPYHRRSLNAGRSSEKGNNPSSDRGCQ